MKKVIFFLTIALFAVSCKNAPEKSENNSSEATALTVNDFYANPDQYLGAEVTVKGLVTHVCKHGGQKLFIVGTDDGESLRIDVGEGIPEFALEMEGSEVEFTGVIDLMDDAAVAAFAEEHPQDSLHAEEEGGDYHTLKEKNYHLVAKTFKNI